VPLGKRKGRISTIDILRFTTHHLPMVQSVSMARPLRIERVGGHHHVSVCRRLREGKWLKLKASCQMLRRDPWPLHLALGGGARSGMPQRRNSVGVEGHWGGITQGSPGRAGATLGCGTESRWDSRSQANGNVPDPKGQPLAAGKAGLRLAVCPGFLARPA
jgi:hypothetical protein